MKKIIIGIIAVFTLIISINGVHAYIPDNTFYYGKTELIDYEVSNDGLYYTNTLRFRFTSKESNDFPNDYEVGETNLLHIFNIFKDYRLNEYQFYSINKYIFSNDDTLLLLRAGQVIDTIGKPNRIMFDLEGDTIRFENKDGYSIYHLNYDDINVSDTFILKTERSFLADAEYQQGYNHGKHDGFNEGYEEAYDTAIENYGFYYNGEWLTAEQWGNIRFQDGINANPTDNPLAVLFGGLSSLLGVAFAFVLQLGSIELLGISLNMILGIGLLLVGILAILGLIFGGK